MQTNFDRYARTNIESRLHVDQISPLRLAFMEWIASIKPNKYVTINFDRLWSPELAEKHLEQWFRRLHQRLYRRSPEKSGARYLEMHGCCEYGGDQSIHYHIAVCVPDDYQTVFDQKAQKAWYSVLPKSRFHVRDYGDTDLDQFKAARYSTKSRNFDQWWRPLARPKDWTS